MDARAVGREDALFMGFTPREAVAAAEAPAPAIEWEETNCLLCGSPRWSILTEAPDNLAGAAGLWFAVVKCKDCGLAFTNPRPTTSSMARFYPPSYFPKRAPSPFEQSGRKSKTRPAWPLTRTERKVLPIQGEGRLLDFGCGGGSYLHRMHQQGWKVTGLDVAGPAVERIRSELGLTALVGTLPHPQLQPASFDIITMWHSLEHVHNPAEILRQAYFHLAPTGKLVVAVPNIDSLPFKWFGHCWYGLDLPRHLTHFSPQTLRWMLERSGFRVGPIRMVRQTSWLRSSARLASEKKCEPRWARLLTRRGGSRLAAWWACLIGRSDYMLVTARRTD
jgi:SAM-dependent methyltransferase